MASTKAGFWTMTDREPAALRKHLLKGGFIILDDFRDDFRGAGWGRASDGTSTDPRQDEFDSRHGALPPRSFRALQRAVCTRPVRRPIAAARWCPLARCATGGCTA